MYRLWSLYSSNFRSLFTGSNVHSLARLTPQLQSKWSIPWPNWFGSVVFLYYSQSVHCAPSSTGPHEGGFRGFQSCSLLEAAFLINEMLGSMNLLNIKLLFCSVDFCCFFFPFGCLYFRLTVSGENLYKDRTSSYQSVTSMYLGSHEKYRDVLVKNWISITDHGFMVFELKGEGMKSTLPPAECRWDIFNRSLGVFPVCTGGRWPAGVSAVPSVAWATAR